MTALDLAIEACVSLLLAATMIYTHRLARALGRARQDRAELAHLIERIEGCSQQANEGIRHLKATAEPLIRRLDGIIGQGREVRADLARALEEGRAAAVGLVGRASREATPMPEVGASAPRVSGVEQELSRALARLKG